MRGNEQTPIPSNELEEKQTPLNLVVRLMQETANMKHIDEVFLWLSTTMTKRLDINVTQFWAIQRDQVQQTHTQVRASSSLNPILPQQVHINRQVASVIEHCLNERRGSSSMLVEQVFSPTQAAMLTQYNLNYWAAYFLSHTELLPLRATTTADLIPTPLTMLISFFTAYPLSKEQERTISFISEQALRIIVTRKLLLPPQSIVPQKTDILSNIAHLIPSKFDNLALSQADNPFANATIINDKNARRLYTSIDGRKSVSDLLQITNFTNKEMYYALQYLYEHRNIELTTPKGEKIDGTSIF